jgi:hypothetical protein
MSHPSIKNELLAYTCDSVAKAIGWTDLDSFERIDLPLPCRFVLRSGRERMLLVMYDDRPGFGLLVHAEDRSGPEHVRCDRLISDVALRAFRGDFGEAARNDAVARFRRLRDIDLAEDGTGLRDLEAALDKLERHPDLMPHVDALCDLRRRLDTFAAKVSSAALDRMQPLPKR